MCRGRLIKAGILFSEQNIKIDLKSSVTSDFECSKPILQGVASKLFYSTSMLFFLLYLLIFPSLSYSFMSDMSDTEIAVFQKEIASKPVGDRIAIWAEKFVGTPYDPDPLGEYVTKKVIVADKNVDCMYLSFRAVELALSLTPDKAVDIALDKRFMTKGRLDSRGNVINYSDRFQYGEDMLDSGKWGKEITGELAKVTKIKGSRGREKVKMISKKDLLKSIRESRYQSIKGVDTFKSGDFIFFVKAVERRKAGEIIGHIGIIKIDADSQQSAVSKNEEQKKIYLIHAGGLKNKGGKVKKEMLYDYVKSMPFTGVRVSRFN